MARHDDSKSRVTPKGTTSTAPAGSTTSGSSGSSSSSPSPADRTPVKIDGPSPLWVPILMFGLLGLGVIIILLNYVAPIPGAPSNWYLLGGLAAVLAGIIAATQYR